LVHETLWECCQLNHPISSTFSACGLFLQVKAEIWDMHR
jgi:hypothetical protein